MAPLRGMGAQIPVPLFIFPERSSHMAEKQLTTIEQLRALAERGKQDTLIRINELLDSMIPLLETSSSWLTENTGTLCAPTQTALWRQARPA